MNVYNWTKIKVTLKHHLKLNLLQNSIVFFGVCDLNPIVLAAAQMSRLI